MKSTLLSSAILVAITAGCGAAPSHLENSAALNYNSPIKCTIQTYDGHYLTAVGGGGRITDAIHTDATRVGAWEKFTLVDSRDGSPVIKYGIQTANGRFLTVVGGGGRITDVIHTDATQLRAWEKITVYSEGAGVFTMQTINGRYLTAMGGGNRINDVIHSDAIDANAWEKFRFKCGNI